MAAISQAQRKAQNWQRRHVLGLMGFTLEEYTILVQTTGSFCEVIARPLPKVPTLQGKVVANLFFEPSTRTRNSFELAAKRLSADVINFSPSTSSLSKGESILDTTRTFLAMGADLIIVRHRQAGVPQMIVKEIHTCRSHGVVLNAGDGQHEHPTQGLLDLYTLCAHLDPQYPDPRMIRGQKIAIVGDILHSRVARSNLWCLTTLGADVHLVGPPSLVPKTFERFGAKVHWDLTPALEGARFVMALRLQRERMEDQVLPSLRDYHQRYGLTRQRLQRCDPQVKLLHPGPVNRGVEVASDLMEDPQISVIDQQVTHGVALRMAILYLMGGGPIPD